MPDVLGRALFAGVGNGTEAGTDGAVEDVPELLRWMTDLRRIEADAEDQVPMGERLLERRHRVIGRAITQEAHDQVRRHPALSRLGQGPTDPADNGFELHAARDMGLWVEENLYVTNALLAGTGEVGDGELEKIPFVDEDRTRPVINVQERLEVGEPVGPSDRFRVRIREAYAVALGQLEHQLGLERSLDVQVQLGLGQPERVDHHALVPRRERCPGHPATRFISSGAWQLPSCVIGGRLLSFVGGTRTMPAT